VVAEFYELPLDRVAELTAVARGIRGTRVMEILSHLREVSSYESPYYHLAAVLGVLDSKQLADATEVLSSRVPPFDDLETALVENQGGGWDVIEPSAARIAALDPAAFDSERLRAHYAGETEYYPDVADSDEQRGFAGTLFDLVFPRTSDRVPADAGELMLRDIELVRDALLQTRAHCVLLIHVRPTRPR